MTGPTSSAAATERTVRSGDGTCLRVAVTGLEGGRPVVLCHGLGLTRHSWGPVARALAREHRVIAYDLRGHGDSGRAAGGDYGLSAHADDLAAVLEAEVDPDRAAVVVGHSLGGGIILAHAHHHAVQLIAGVVFAASGGSAITLPGLPPGRWLRWAQRPLRSGWLVVLRVLAAVLRRVRPVHRLADALIRRLAFEPDPPAEAVRQVREHFAVSRPEVLAETTRASGAHDGATWAPELDVPALVIHGEQDPQVSSDEARRLAERLPASRLVELRGAGHMLPLTHADAVAGHVAAFLRELP